MVHPLDQLTPQELKLSVDLLRQQNKNDRIHFKFVANEEPPKKLLAPYLEAERAGQNPTPPPRVAHMCYYILNHKLCYESWVSIDNKKIIKTNKLAKGAHPPIDPLEASEAHGKAWQSPLVKQAMEKCGLTEEQKKNVEIDGWMYGCDQEGDVPRYMMMLVYCRDPKANHLDSNLYAMPLPFVPVYDVLEDKLVRVDWCATGSEQDDKNGINYSTLENEGGNKSLLDNCQGNEYHADLQPSLRNDLKPLNVTQPEGPSFSVDGSLVQWQKWRFRAVFHPREGLVLHDVCYDGRKTFYRLSMSEMAVPYGDPRPPLHRKMALDIGDCGAKCVNSLELGCDCLGTIKYFDGHIVEANGDVTVRKSVICMHEQDDGILWKHTNYRTDNPSVVRRRILVLQQILTVGNYEYIFAWHLDQAAGIKLEIRATGIVSTQYIDPGKKSPWGNIVSPSALAACHQHIFNMRIDPAIDGHDNSIVVSENHPVPWDEHNPYGTGFRAFSKPVEKSSAFDADIQSNRTVKMVNENKLNPISGNPIGYKVVGSRTALAYSHPDAVASKRTAFTHHHYWVSKYKDQELYAGGVWTNQSSKEIDGVGDAIARGDNVRNEDVVLWHTFGLTHNVRVEDFPVMPTEMLQIELVPTDFFDKNPSIDVPPSTQKFNRSVDAMENRCCNKL